SASTTTISEKPCRLRAASAALNAAPTSSNSASSASTSPLLSHHTAARGRPSVPVSMPTVTASGLMLPGSARRKRRSLLVIVAPPGLADALGQRTEIEFAGFHVRQPQHPDREHDGVAVRRRQILHRPVAAGDIGLAGGQQRIDLVAP